MTSLSFNASILRSGLEVGVEQSREEGNGRESRKVAKEKILFPRSNEL